MELVAEDQLAPRAAQGRVEATAADAGLLGPQRFDFTGTGAEYFRIWVVNLLLTFATFGIYSAWAKVRRLQYFYRNTRVAGAIFDYHGKPLAILKGRLLALVLLGAYKIASDVSFTAAVMVVLILALVMPWLLARAFHFKLINSSYRGLRFHFRGTVGDAYRMLILFPITLAFVGLFVWSLATSFSSRPGIGLIFLIIGLPLVAFAITVPLAHYLLKRYQHDNADFGLSPFFFHARTRDFFKIYAKAIGIFILSIVPGLIFIGKISGVYSFFSNNPFAWLFGWLFGMLYSYAFYFFVRAYMESRTQNLVWQNTELAGHRFECAVRARRLMWIHASNLMLIVLTLGLYKPFATVRLVKYRVESMALVPDGDLEEFLADLSPDNAGAIGQEAGDLFDIDIAL
jgi:uncharacterized membrane protein YjgN (DUF898 family)